ncbi:MAG: hypothetical protein ACOZDY_18520 [Pseudomonadota bacterium]
MCGFIEKLLGGGSAPTVIYQTPAADTSKADAEASSKAMQSRNKRRRGTMSLLATGSGAGDTSSPVTGLPSAQAGKSLLGQ